MEKHYFVLVHRRTSDGSIVVHSQVFTPEKLFFTDPLEFRSEGFEFLSVNEISLPI